MRSLSRIFTWMATLTPTPHPSDWGPPRSFTSIPCRCKGPCLAPLGQPPSAPSARHGQRRRRRGLSPVLRSVTAAFDRVPALVAQASRPDAQVRGVGITSRALYH
eukprot:gene9940-biopygen12276